jgi:hypothetical protein
VIEIATDKELSIQAALAEFTELRAEVLHAFSMQWNIVALQLTATSVLFSFALTNHSRTGFLLIVPIVCYVLSGRYLRTSRVIILIGTYIRTELSPRVPGGLNWEGWIGKRPNPGRFIRWLAHGPLVFSAISLAALAWLVPYVLFANDISTFSRWMLGIVWFLDLAATLVSVYMVKVTLGVSFQWWRKGRKRT